MTLLSLLFAQGESPSISRELIAFCGGEERPKRLKWMERDDRVFETRGADPVELFRERLLFRPPLCGAWTTTTSLPFVELREVSTRTACDGRLYYSGGLANEAGRRMLERIGVEKRDTMIDMSILLLRPFLETEGWTVQAQGRCRFDDVECETLSIRLDPYDPARRVYVQIASPLILGIRRTRRDEISGEPEDVEIRLAEFRRVEGCMLPFLIQEQCGKARSKRLVETWRIVAEPKQPCLTELETKGAVRIPGTSPR
jgi:hypothetical protein